MGNISGLAFSSLAIIFIFGLIIAILSRYKKCPSDKILVKYGMVGSTDSGTNSAKCIHGGATLVWPVFQAYRFLDLTPMSIEVNLQNALSKQNIRIDVPSRFTVGISTEPEVMQNAAERLLALKNEEIQELAKDIIFGQLRLVVATMDIEEINTDRDKFLEEVSRNVESELKKIGLRLINVNITDISDESGYIDALGKEAAAKAVNDAKISVSQKNRDGLIGEANAVMDQRVKVSDANAIATEGENAAKIKVAESDATRREMEAIANKRAVTAEKIQQAKALEESYAAQKAAEIARAEKELATKEADEIVQAEIDKRRMEIQAEAEAERTRRHAKGEADAIYMKLEAQAKGLNEMLVKQAEGFKKLVEAAGGAEDAMKLMIVDKLPELIEKQVEAIKNIKIDKVTVWDNLGGDDGKTNTAKFVSGMMKSVPPLNEIFDMAGLDLPGYLGTKKVEAPTPKEEVPTLVEELEE
ncbi:MULTISPECIES: flotillin family protein [unclassified Fusibacter]|uniref:flotillin family protein n=1 Tax=unclassified Fusibacter TaxID=2624464 RepID=UPI0010129F55|nr:MULTISPECIES: flotillin family protein [unclassified Fusibacter]MCK8059620.1 SPFH domain-containing protein [Fusibacter sp. A2]NPE21421.1 flotillin family protein [Fusibacter sp. A1]RXV62102.1 flotillin family protein [Fusibacter sp. A1]